MSCKHCAVIVVTLVAAGCAEMPGDGDTPGGVESRRSNVSYFSKQYVTVPAYWDPQGQALDFDTLSDWDNHNSKGAIKSVVVNLGCEADGGWDSNTNTCLAQPGLPKVAGGPGSDSDPNLATKQAALAAKIANLHASGIQVYGYVSFYANRPTGDIQIDIGYGWWEMQWHTNQFLDGYFFDQATRTSSKGLARAEYFTSLAQSYTWSPGNLIQASRVIFNYGETQPFYADFVGCLATYDGNFNWFVSEETDYNTYNGIDPWGVFATGGDWAWMNGYMPDHFINVINGVDGNSVTLTNIQDWTNKSRILNAGQLYIMQSTPNYTYQDLAQNSAMNPGVFPIFDYVEGDSAGDTAEYDHGAASDPPPGPCVAEDANAPE